VSLLDAALCAGFNSGTSFIADLAVCDYSLHGRPVRFDPASIMTAIAALDAFGNHLNAPRVLDRVGG
jgi:hypothetical protein